MERVVIIVYPGNKNVGVRISDGIHISFRGSMSVSNAGKFLREVKKLEKNDREKLFEVAVQYGLKSPHR